eukprot:scaffold13289_cov82-Skeletonema_dohrnii-CCMP3373.AAC.2
MPHPAPQATAAAADSSTISVEQPTTTAVTTNPLVAQAHNSANSIFQTHVQTVLQHSTSMGLRRLIKSRIRAHFLQDETIHNAAGVGNTAEEPDASILFKENPTLLQVTQEDVDKCYSFANRVGIKWANELKRQGCVDFSDIVLQVLNKGHYLEPTCGNNRSDTEEQQNSNHNNETDNDEANGNNNSKVGTKTFATPYAALHSLRRFEPDCDGSGKPSKHLRPIRQDENDVSARKIIHQIDEMARNNQTYWHHGWDAVEEAVKRNRERIDYSRANQEDEMKEGTNKSKGRIKRVHFEDDSREEQADDAAEASKKRRCDAPAADAERVTIEIGTVDKPDETIRDRGRPASLIGDTVYSWEDISQSMSPQERRELIKTAMHPPYPFEETAADDGSNVAQPTATTEEECGANIVGALKAIGLTHLFEQTRHLPKEHQADDVDETKQNSSNGFQSLLGASETRASFKSQQLDRMKKKAMRKAEKERLGRRAPVLGEKNADYYGFGAVAGKVKLTEEDRVSTNAKREAPSGNSLSLQIHDEPERQRWLEFDLGECVLEEIDEDSNNSDGADSAQDKKKRFLAFRSLEMAIMD